MKEEKIARVKCLTCNSEHNYKKAPKKRVPAKKGTSPAKRGGSSKNPEIRWESALTETKGPDIPYDMARAFKVKDIVLHKTFGRGVVLIVADKRMTLIFKDKERILASSNLMVKNKRGKVGYAFLGSCIKKVTNDFPNFITPLIKNNGFIVVTQYFPL